MRLSFCILILSLFTSVLCVAQRQRTSESKISAALARRLYYPAFEDSIDILLALKKGSLTEAEKRHYRVLQSYQNIIAVRIRLKGIVPVLQDSNTIFADIFKKPKEELTTGALDLAVNKLNISHSRFPAVDGGGILASIKEQQLDSTDIDYLGRYVNTGMGAPTSTTHAAVMATTLAGGANTSPFAKGAASGALVTSTSFASLLPESDSYYQLFQIPIQNHSYGTVIENYYGAEAAAYDANVVNNPTLVHVFSAGNSGTATGVEPYAGLPGWSNLTGNFKTAKNVLVVGAIDSFYSVSTASSKGPAFDGRIKPDLVAFGEDGSSGAAALVSGTVALLQQAYRIKHLTLPIAAVTKAVLLNSADDVAQKGIDFASGYGSLNGYNALQTIVQNHFFEDSIQQGGLKKFRITIPPNRGLLKVTLAWTDAPAPVNVAKALINDLDIQVQNSSGRDWLPWVLNASKDALTNEATRQRDSLNNVEQITIATPPTGDYTITVKGNKVISGMQPFAIAYQVDSADQMEWTFPTKQDVLIAGQSAVLRWQTALHGTAALEYSTNASDWQLLSDTVSLARNYYKWAVPDTLTTAQLRMRVTNAPPVLSDTFVISKTVNIKVGFDCIDSALLFWNALPVSEYKIYHLGERYLEPFTTVADTTIILQTASNSFRYFSVAPIIDGHEGLKSFTVNYKAQGVACYIRGFYVQVQTQSSAAFTLLIGTGYNLQSIDFQKLGNGGYRTLQSVTDPGALTFAFLDSVLKQGVNSYRIQITLKNGVVLYSETVSIYHISNGSVLIYPNPAPQQLPVTLITNKAGRVNIEVFDAAGRLVRRQLLAELVNKITLSGLTKGLYLVHIIEDDGTRSTQKLVVY
jgi:hypothetical protein